MVSLALTVATLWARPATTQDVRRQYVELHMGMALRIVVYAADDATARRAARAAYARIAELENVMSDYRPESEVRRLAARAGEPVRVSDDLFVVLARAVDLWRRSDGAFDPTVGPFVELWRAARRTGRLPPRAELDSAARRVGSDKVHLDSVARTVRLDAPGMRIDLGGIAKGYILDRALDALRAQGVTRALLEAGGDIVLGDAPPGRRGWRIALPEGDTILANHAVSTSGDTEQHVEIEGKRYSHIVDPATGLGMTNRIQATIIAPDATTTDSLDTTVCLLGVTNGLALVESFPRMAASRPPMRPPSGRLRRLRRRDRARPGPTAAPDRPPTPRRGGSDARTPSSWSVTPVWGRRPFSSTCSRLFAIPPVPLLSSKPNATLANLCGHCWRN